MLLAKSRVMASTRSGPRSGTKRATAAKKTPRAKSAKRTTGRASSAPRTGSSSSKSKASTKTARPASKKRSASRAPLAEYNAKRDFARTAEPAGKVPKPRGKTLHFVIQKHAASHLHYDLRLELDGVMKSWAVPKGPSLDPTVRRLAMEVEDHPISYNTFEGTIPQGEYGGGTVMLWDRGTYEADDDGGAVSLRRGYEKGELRFVMHGERLRGGFVLARLKRPGRPQWLLIKRRDDHVDANRDITAEETTSVVSKRTMEQIAAGRRVWRSNR
ncbi:MAG TPA: DNA polymerase ligase N-terminal domain-containing protein [Gemmatimonadaceae bacterium]|nr:DNA polymerase ligase N-terminal domain-containing protein [Gemmatimonadaceae bacterium]